VTLPGGGPAGPADEPNALDLALARSVRAALVLSGAVEGANLLLVGIRRRLAVTRREAVATAATGP
jgi:hypothetical protein